jgi:hypothetical protein
MFLLMNYVRSVIASHLLHAITVYQDDEVLQDFMDFIQQKVIISVLCWFCPLKLYLVIQNRNARACAFADMCHWYN